MNKNSGLPIIENPFPLVYSPLVQCMTNVVTVESMANAILYIDGKPVMADQPWEFEDFMEQTDALLLNLGGFSPDNAQALLVASMQAQMKQIPTVVDLVGVAGSSLRLDIAYKILKHKPTVVKGNYSELRKFCQLTTTGRGVDSSDSDQEDDAITELAQAMKLLSIEHPETLFLATGAKDIIAFNQTLYHLDNGVENLDRFTGTGDIVGALIATLLGEGKEVLAATISAVSYFNLCGEKADSMTKGLANFRQETLNQLSLLMEDKEWMKSMRGGLINGL
ncbi:hydroxyethylthiazole kinase [Aerococcaceae bacterium WGS1372]